MRIQDLVKFFLLSATLCLFISCESNTSEGEGEFEKSIRALSAQKDSLKQENGQLSVQNSAFTGPVKKVLSQEELIIKYKVKTVKEASKEGWVLSTYDKNGNKIAEETNFSYKKKISYVFDHKGRITEEVHKSSDGIVKILTYTYNEAGKLIRKTETLNDSKPSVSQFEYDVALNTRTERSSIGSMIEFYDNRGLCVRFEHIDENGRMQSSVDSKYDADGLLIRESGTLMRKPFQTDYEYNEDGQLRKQQKTGMFASQLLLEYDAKGLLTRDQLEMGKMNDETIYRYTFY